VALAQAFADAEGQSLADESAHIVAERALRRAQIEVHRRV
jgi:hypothetical protein